jgi:hypothetical protein
MATYQKFQSFTEQQLIAPCDFNTDTFKFALTNTAPNLAADDFFNDIVEIAAGNGYVAGGLTISGFAASRTGGVTKILCDDEVLTATGAIGPFRYVVLYKSTGVASTSTLIAMWDYGSAVTMANGETFTFDVSAVNGLFSLT